MEKPRLAATLTGLIVARAVAGSTVANEKDGIEQACRSQLEKRNSYIQDVNRNEDLQMRDAEFQADQEEFFATIYEPEFK